MMRTVLVVPWSSSYEESTVYALKMYGLCVCSILNLLEWNQKVNSGLSTHLSSKM